MLADRFGGRLVFTVLMLFVAVPVALVPAATGYRNLLIVAFLLGMAGSSFAVGVGYVSRWFSMESQGSALGVYGLGNIGQSAAVFLGPVVAAAYGYRAVYWGMSIILLVWTGVFVVVARNAPHAPRPKGLSEMLGVLAREPLAWALAAFYFLTFGGLVPSRSTCLRCCAINLGCGPRMPVSEQLDSSCSPRSAARSVAGYPTALADREFFHGFCPQWLPSDCCWVCSRCFHSPLERSDALPCSALAMALYFSSCLDISQLNEPRSPDLWARWVGWVDFSRLCFWACSATDSESFGRDFFYCRLWPVFSGG